MSAPAIPGRVAGLATFPASHSGHDYQAGTAGGGLISMSSDAQMTGVAARRRKGQKANWSTLAKMRSYLIAESCIKQMASPYRAEYDSRRAHTAITHPEWTAGHSHNDALRIVSKAVLRDFWRESKRLHEQQQAQPSPIPQVPAPAAEPLRETA